MPYADLSFVTSTLEELLTDNQGSFEPMLSYDTTNRAPNEITPGDQAVVSLYLHHVNQSAFHVNLPGPGGASDPAANPVALSLFYVVTVHRNVPANDTDRYERERIFGHVVKTFHDFPVVVVKRPASGGLGPDLTDQIEIALRPVTPELANAFWSNSGWQTGPRLAAFYEVRVVLLEPELPTRIPAPVLTIGNRVVSLSIPHIDATENTFTVTAPGAEPVELNPSPAQLSMDSGPATMILRGNDLLGLDTSAQVTPPGTIEPFELPVVAKSPGEVSVQIPLEVGGQVLPSGFYMVRLRQRNPAPQLGLRSESNKAVFAIVPTLQGISTMTPEKVAAFSIVPAPTSNAEVTVTVGGNVLEVREDVSDTTPAIDAPGFVNRDGAAALIVTLSILSGGPLPVRVMVDGVASRPEWLFV